MKTITELSDRFVDEFAAVDPVRASFMGVGRDSTAITDWSPTGIEAMAGLMRRTVGHLDRLTAIDDVERRGAAYLADTATAELGLIETGERECRMSNEVGPPSMLLAAFDLMARDTPEDWERIAVRMAGVPDALAGYMTSLRTGVGHGVVASVRLVAAVAESCRRWAGTGADGVFSEIAEQYGEGKLRAELDTQARGADEAYGRLADWLTAEYAPHAVERDGVGGDRYRVWARAYVGIEALDLDEAYDWATIELERLEQAKLEECARILPGASYASVVDLLQNDPARSIDGVDGFHDWLQGLTDEALGTLHGTEFDIPEPLRRCEVHTPLEGWGSGPYYMPPAEDLSTPGRIVFPTVGAARFPRWSHPTTVYHEAVPGHHLEVGGNRVTRLTRAHRLGLNSAYSEGWALYAERLMDELDWFTTPDSRLGFLSMQAFRAARVVIDIGLHTGRVVPESHAHAGTPWTFEVAVEFLEHAGGVTRPEAIDEVLRYLSWPSQAIGYKLGERAWLAARDQAKNNAGAVWDRRVWHSRALALGPMSLDRLSTELANLGDARP